MGVCVALWTNWYMRDYLYQNHNSISRPAGSADYGSWETSGDPKTNTTVSRVKGHHILAKRTKNIVHRTTYTEIDKKHET